MNSTFIKLFGFFIISFIISMIVVAFVIINSFSLSFDKWRSKKISTLQTTVYYIIKDHFRSDNPSFVEIRNKLIQFLPENVVVTFYEKDKATIKSKIYLKLRQPISSLTTMELYPILVKDKAVYYYSIAFYDPMENEIFKYFFQAIKQTLLYSIIISFVISSILAFLFSFNFSNQAKKISGGLNIIAGGEFNISLKEKGTREFSLISKSANILVKKLLNEQTLRNQWMQDITHDLRTPITAIKAQLEGIKDGVLDFSINRINKNLSELKRMEDLINDLADLTILESQDIIIKKEIFDINAMLNEIKNSFSAIIKNKKIIFKINSLKNISMNGDKKLLKRAFYNIVDNAVKFTDKNGNMSIKIIKNNDSIEIIFYNSDSYIKPGEHDKIFDRLYRGEYARNTEGTGLGLTITKKIISLHKGVIKVESRKNYGTSFIVTFLNNINN